MVLYGDNATESYFFVHPFTVTQDVPSRYGLIEVKISTNISADSAESVSLLKIPLDFVSPELRENIMRDEDVRISLEEYIRAFKLGNIKHKHRVFTMTAPPAPPAPIGKLIAMAKISEKAQLFQ